MLKNLVKLEHIVANKAIHLLCDNDAPLASVKEALCQFLKYIGQIEDQVKAQQEQAKAEAEAKAKDTENKPEEQVVS